MKFQQYINEEKNIPKKEILPLIKKNCSTYIQEMKKVKGTVNLYRGTSHIFNDMIYKTVRSNRLPKDMKIKAHNRFNIEFKKKFGIKARSETLIASPSSPQAQAYGSFTHMVMPIGNFKFIYSEQIYDLYSDIGIFLPDFLSQVQTSYLEMFFMGDDDEDPEKWLKYKLNHGYISQESYDSIKEKKENYINNIINDIMKTYKMTSSLRQLRGVGEVMINCKEYYLISQDVYFDLIIDALRKGEL